MRKFSQEEYEQYLAAKEQAKANRQQDAQDNIMAALSRAITAKDRAVTGAKHDRSVFDQSIQGRAGSLADERARRAKILEARYRSDRDQVIDEREAERARVTAEERAYGRERDAKADADAEAERKWRREQAAAKAAEAKRAAAAKEAKESAKSSADQVRGESTLRKEFEGNKVIKDYRVKRGATEAILANPADTPPAQMSMIFQYMKMLDPTSTVREGEYANAQNTTGIPGQIINLYNRAKDGQFLNPEQIAEFKKAAQLDLQAYEQGTVAPFVQRYRGLATDYGYSPDRVAAELEAREAQGVTEVRVRNPETGKVYKMTPAQAKEMIAEGGELVE